MTKNYRKEDLEYCKNLILDFLQLEKQDCNIDYFTTLNLGCLWDDEHKNRYIYGKFRASSDEDSFHLVKAIYYILWNKYLPNMDSFDDMERYYGGDTINPVRNSKKYLTIGNFMLLPKSYHKKNETFNIYKYITFRDDFYKFMKKIQDLYKNKITKEEDINNITDEQIWEKIVIINNWYFKKVKTFDDFVKINMLEGWENLKNSEFDAIENFIKNRSIKMIKNLKEILKA